MIGKGIKFVLLQLALALLINRSSSEDILLNLNTKKVVALTSDKFLSLTIDPAVLLTGDVLTSSTELSTNMAKALAPGYVRLAGPRSNTYTFERSLFPQSTGYEDPDQKFSEAHWVLVQQWAQRSGLDVVSSLTPQRIENEDQVTTWDPRNSLDLISFSDHMGYNMSWQLGYECQTRCDISGFDLGKDVARLKNMLGAFPRYSNSIIAGPDIVSFRGKQQQQYIQDYLNAAGNALSVITWHPDFAGIALDSDGVSLQIDTLASDKDLLYKSMGRSVARKPLWIAESKPEECKRQFLGALVWARRLGNAAKLGVQVIMRQPDASNIFHPTPDYWVSLLHKMLVGREVLDSKLTLGNRTHVHFYCQCTKPSSKYEKGAVTIFGINLTPSKISVSLKGLKIKAVHKYILMPGYDSENRMFAETVLLNNEPLDLVNGKNLPEINPAVTLLGKNMAVKLPSGGIGFWVIPGARVKSCLGHDDEASDKNLLLKKFAKKLEEPENGDENLVHDFDEDHHQESEVEAENEDIISLLKSKKKKRKYRHSDENDDEDRRFKRIDTKKELEKLEKLLKRNNNNEEKKSSHFKGRVGLAIFDNEANDSGENKEEDISAEDLGLVRFKNEKTDSGEEIRTKLEEYRNKLIQYETRKQLNEKNDDHRFDKPQISSSRANLQPDEQFSTDVDTQKAVEALALISKVEGAIKEFEGSNEKKNYEVGPSNQKPAELGTDIGEEMLIDELQKSEKIKRMIDPKSFDKLYNFLVGNSQHKIEKRSAEDFRVKRDLEKLLGDDPLGLRKEGLFKKRLKNDEAKERRLERRNKKKDKDDIGLKKELPVARYDPRITDSSENNFFGFPQMKPVENFPQGDLFLTEGTSSEEKSHDYDYVKEDDDDDDEQTTQPQKPKKRRKTKPKRKQKNMEVDETWVEEPNSNYHHAPNEFFERLNVPPVTIKTQWKDYGELYEPESLQQREFNDEQKNHEHETGSDAVIVKDQTEGRDDKKAKETAVNKLINYYDNSNVLRTEPEFNDRKPRLKAKKNMPKFRPEQPTQTTVKEMPKSKPEVSVQDQNSKKPLELDNNYDTSDDLGSMEFVSSKAAEDYYEETYENDDVGAKKRPKRRISNLDYEVFGQEMIREDAGNLKDCKCRVIRSTGKLICKNCKRNRRLPREIMQLNTSEEDFTYPASTTDAGTVTDQDSAVTESMMTEELPVHVSKAPEISQEATASQDIVYSKETTLGNPENISSSSDVESVQKNAEVADLIGDTHESKVSEVSIDDVIAKTSSSEAKNEDDVALELSNPSMDEEDSKIIGSSEAGEAGNDFHEGLQQVVSGSSEGKIEADEVVGSQRLYENKSEEGAAQQDPEVPSIDQKSITQTAEEVKKDKISIDIEDNVNAEDLGDENQAKRNIPEALDAASDTQSNAKLSMSTGASAGSSAKAGLVGSKLRTNSNLKLKSETKSSGVKSDSAKSKLVLNTEALSTLIKESESKKAEVLKALESSAKLKSVDNTKYVEYQKKREEKLATLKDKLRERKAKILQQYRQELLDALSKCDTEVERNLKRREIWDDFSQQEEFDEFVDKDKLAYLMMHRPVNYEHVEGQNDQAQTEDRRYYPVVQMTQPLHNARQQKIPETESRRYFYAPKAAQLSTSSQDSSDDSVGGDQSSLENMAPMPKSRFNDDESYYAIVESLENPIILHKKDFDNVEFASGNKNNEYNRRQHAKPDEIDFDGEKSLQYKKSMSKKYSHHPTNGQLYKQNHKTERTQQYEYEPDQRFFKNYGQEQFLDRQHGQQSAHPVYTVDSSVFNVDELERDAYDENLSPDQVVTSQHSKYPKVHDNQKARGIAKMGYKVRDDSWSSLIPEYYDGILHHKQYSRPIDSGIREKSSRRQQMEVDQRSQNPEDFAMPKLFAFDTRMKNSQDEFHGNDIPDFRLGDGLKIVQSLELPGRSGNHGGENSFGNKQELEELQSYYEGPLEDHQLANEGLRLINSERQLIPHDKQQVLEEPAYKITQVNSRHDSSVRKEREIKEKESNYICLREDSGEDTFEDEKRLFKLVRDGDHYEAVPISEIPEETGTGKLRRNYRRIAKQNEKVRSKRRNKYSTDVFPEEDRNYYARREAHVRRNSPRRQYSDSREVLEGKSHSDRHVIDYPSIGDEINHLESDPRLNPEEYELLMLIPVKKHKVKRGKRDLDNSIDRLESYEETNSIWDDIVDVKKNENRLQEYIDGKEKIVRDFEEAQANLNNYLKKLESMEDPTQIQKFEEVILNMGSADQDKMGVVAKSQDEMDRIHLGEYLKQEILKKIHSNPAETDKSEILTTSDPGSFTTSSLFEAAIPKLEGTINEELEKVGDLTESFEDFINDFDKKYNSTLEAKGNETANEAEAKKNKISYSIFHNAINSVKKFFDFLTGVTLIFGRH